ncbi:MAG: tail fiber domain-containing protein, partial [Bacteroidota bacterium]
APGNIIQLGFDCSNIFPYFFNTLTSNRYVPIGNRNLWFSNFINQTGGVGIGGQPTTAGGFCGVGNTLELSANGASKYGSANSSGLRFTQLTSASPVLANGVNGINNSKILTVDQDGDVVLTNAANTLGNNCGLAQNPLPANYEIPIANNNFVFSRTLANTGNVGIGTLPILCTPGNLLEVSKGAVNNISGLRLTDLAGATPLASNNQVLSVNPANGDVILTNAPAAVNLGGVCASGANPLTSNWEIPLNNNNFIFGGQGAVNNNVGIGTTCAPIAKLDVLQNSGSFVGSIGINIDNQDNPGPTLGTTDVIGIKSLVSGTGCAKVAGWFESPGGGGCPGIPINTAIYVPQNGGGVSIGYPSPAGNGFGSLLEVNGSIEAASITYPSDATLKNTVTNIPNSLAIIKKLRPVTYNWNTPLSPDMAGLHAGFIAQEVDTVLPHLVKTSLTSGKKSVAYTELIPYLVKAIQQLEKQNHTQDSLITALTSSVSSCCSNSNVRLTGITGGTINQQNINLSDADVIVLNQNTPNPFAEQTTITYNVPAKYKFAQMVFKTIEGKIIRTVDITTKGRGQLNVFANDLSAGLYVYSLIVDGEIVDTKKMVKE